MSYFPDSVSLEPMNPTIKAQWLEALRSGEYKQGRECLRQDDKDAILYCCLGVLCDLHRKATGTHQWEALSDEDLIYSYAHNEKYLPATVEYWAKLPFKVGSISAEGILAEANDDGVDFPTIADWIEANL